MLISFLLVSSLLLIDPSTGCCCNIKWSCGCNAFGCNCVTVNGWCKKWYHWQGIYQECYSSKGRERQEYCPDRRRMKRSTSTAISQAYGKLHPDLIDRHAMENFLRFDLNRDGLIALEEAKRINATIKDFERVDANNDGFVHPAEFDASLKWFQIEIFHWSK